MIDNYREVIINDITEKILHMRHCVCSRKIFTREYIIDAMYFLYIYEQNRIGSFFRIKNVHYPE